MNTILPPWFRQEIPDKLTLESVRLLSEFKVNTVCVEAKCPNLSHCFRNSKLTFMILGSSCSRGCSYCNVNKADTPVMPLDMDEPRRISQIVEFLGLNYVVITSVTRDDLAGGGADIFVRTIELIRKINSNIKIEVLIPDFSGNNLSLQSIVALGPSVIGHNIETIERLYPQLKPRCDYQLSLAVLRKIKELSPFLLTKSSIIFGLGEREEEVVSTMKDLRGAGCDILTLGQYLAPSMKHYPVKEFISREKFQRYRDLGVNIGFKSVLSGPLVRSSYKAEELYREIVYA